MFTRKKIALFLLMAGIISFLLGMYKVDPIGHSSESKLTAKSLARRELLFREGLLTLSVITIGIGSYLAGSLKTRQTHSFTLDFTGQK